MNTFFGDLNYDPAKIAGSCYKPIELDKHAVLKKSLRQERENPS
jgi:hypothetical protein